MKISKFITFLKEIIFETKFIFSKPKKTQILLYDQGKKFNDQIKKTLKKKNCFHSLRKNGRNKFIRFI